MRPCARRGCGHAWEIHDLQITDRSRERELVVPCGYLDLQPTFGGMFRVRACACPGYVQPAPARLRLANRILGRPLVFALYSVTVLLGLAVLAVTL